MIDFNVPPCVDTAFDYMKEACARGKICGDGKFTALCSAFLCERLGVPAAYLTTSGTSALEMAALLCDIGPGDEVILPSYTFCSTADAFALRGAFRSRKFHVFRAGEGRGIEFVTPKAPVALDVSNAVPELVRVVDYVREHHVCTQTDLFAALGIPMEGVRDAEQDKLYQQFAWIVERGHLIEYHNGVLALPSDRPFFRELARPPRHGAAPKESPAEETPETPA